MPSTFPLPLHRDEGSGDAVVLFHGFPDTAATWDGIADALVADGHRVIVPHLRGYHPDTVNPARGYQALELAEDVLAVLDVCGVEQATLVGHDWGATLVYGAAGLAPERVRGVVACAIPHPRTLALSPSLLVKARHFVALKMPWAAREFASRNFRAVDTLYRRWAPNWVGPERDLCVAHVKTAFADPAVLNAALGYYRDLSPKAPPEVRRRLAMPGLVVGGTRDLVPPEAFEASRTAFTGPIDVEIFDGAGHWPHREDEERFIALLRDFLARLD